MAKSYISIPVGYSRLDNEPLEDNVLFTSLVDAEQYATNDPRAYAGQILSVHDVTSKAYIVEADKTLRELGGVFGDFVERVSSTTQNIDSDLNLYPNKQLSVSDAPAISAEEARSFLTLNELPLGTNLRGKTLIFDSTLNPEFILGYYAVFKINNWLNDDSGGSFGFGGSCGSAYKDVIWFTGVDNSEDVCSPGGRLFSTVEGWNFNNFTFPDDQDYIITDYVDNAGTGWYRLAPGGFGEDMIVTPGTRVFNGEIINAPSSDFSFVNVTINIPQTGVLFGSSLAPTLIETSQYRLPVKTNAGNEEIAYLSDVSGGYTFQEIELSDQIDGTTNVFIPTIEITSDTALSLYYNGQRQFQGIHYNVVNGEIVLTYIPMIGNELFVVIGDDAGGGSSMPEPEDDGRVYGRQRSPGTTEGQWVETGNSSIFTTLAFIQMTSIEDRDLFDGHRAANGCEIKYVVKRGSAAQFGTLLLNKINKSITEYSVTGDNCNVTFEYDFYTYPDGLRVINNFGTAIEVNFIILYL